MALGIQDNLGSGEKIVVLGFGGQGGKIKEGGVMSVWAFKGEEMGAECAGGVQCPSRVLRKGSFYFSLTP